MVIRESTDFLSSLLNEWKCITGSRWSADGEFAERLILCQTTMSACSSITSYLRTPCVCSSGWLGIAEPDGTSHTFATRWAVNRTINAGELQRLVYVWQECVLTWLIVSHFVLLGLRPSPTERPSIGHMFYNPCKTCDVNTIREVYVWSTCIIDYNRNDCTIIANPLAQHWCQVSTYTWTDILFFSCIGKHWSTTALTFRPFRPKT